MERNTIKAIYATHAKSERFLRGRTDPRYSTTHKNVILAALRDNGAMSIYELEPLLRCDPKAGRRRVARAIIGQLQSEGLIRTIRLKTAEIHKPPAAATSVTEEQS